MLQSLPKFALKPTIAAIITFALLSNTEAFSDWGHPMAGFDNLVLGVVVGCLVALYGVRGITLPRLWFAGLAIAGIGVAFLSSALLG